MEMIECLLCASMEEGALGKAKMGPPGPGCLVAPVCLQAVPWGSGHA